jgi:aspartyl-tRNA(Asn)/glutamyl-tRNA(Gln) amidotransferase subunit B
MEQGSLRCDANVSIRPKGSREMGTRTEIKNLNSIRNLEKALEAEIGRQIQLVSSGGAVAHVTLLYDQITGDVRPMRTKEEAHDYRYFPEPDLPPLVVDGQWIEEIRQALVELPWNRRKRFQEEYALGFYDADLLTQTRPLADYYEACVGHLKSGVEGREDAPKAAANWIQTNLLRALKAKGLEADRSPIPPDGMARLVGLVLDGSISGKMGKDVFEEMLKTGQPADSIVKEKGWVQVQDEDAIRGWVVEALESNPGQLSALLGGKDKLRQFFVGQVMKASKGMANPRLLQTILNEEIEARRK